MLETLDNHQHSLGVLAVLYVKFNNLPHPTQGNGAAEAGGAATESKSHDILLFTQLQNFVDKCDSAQICLAPETCKFLLFPSSFFIIIMSTYTLKIFPLDSEVCHAATKILVDQKRSHRGIDLIKRAIRKLQKHDSQLTGAHADLMQLCLLSKNFKPALEFLDVDICSISEEVRVLSTCGFLQVLKCKTCVTCSQFCIIFCLCFRVLKVKQNTSYSTSIMVL